VGVVVDTDLMQRVTPAAHPGLVQTLMHRVRPGSPEQRQQRQRQTGQRAADVMRPLEELLVVPETAPIADVIDRSLAQRVKLVAVVGADGRLVGMVDRADLLAALAPPG
jgi:CBS-domain-containing membrane protein